MGAYPNCTLRLAYNYAPIYVPTYQAPVVTLAAIPYTGLELGVVGTIAYWGFLIFWAVLAAYLLIVKRVQNALAEQLKKLI